MPRYIEGDQPSIDESELHPALLHGETVAVSPAIGRANSIGYQDGWIAVGDGSGEPYIHLVDLSARAVVRSIGRTGDGPGDFKSVFAWSVRPGDSSSVWAFDLTARRLTRVEFSPPAPLQMVLPSIRVVWMSWANAHELVAYTRSDTARFAMLDSTGRLLRRAAGPLLGSESVPLAQRLAGSSQMRLCSRPGSGEFAAIYMEAGRIEMHDSLLRMVTLLRVPFPSNGVFKRDERNGIWEARFPRVYYVSCAATSRYLYALFSGRHRDVIAGVVAANSRFVHIFAWGGQLVTALQLDHDAISIATAGDSVLFGVGSGSDTVFRYRLPPIDTSASRSVRH